MNSRRSGLGVSAPVTHSRTAPSDVPGVEFGAFPASLDPDDRGFYTVDPGGEHRSVEFREVDGQAVLPYADAVRPGRVIPYRSPLTRVRGRVD